MEWRGGRGGMTRMGRERRRGKMKEGNRKSGEGRGEKEDEKEKQQKVTVRIRKLGTE